MLIAIGSGFMFALLTVVFRRYLKGRFTAVAAVVPALIFAYFCSFIPLISSGGTLVQSHTWVPSLGVNLVFSLDGLSLVFALMISGIGTLVFGYTASYLRGSMFINRFYGYLSMFMAAMLGLVLSDNIISIFIFWELTSITSFFLIGYKNDDAASRKSALVALSVTGTGGLMLFAGLLLMASISETNSVHEMLNASQVFQEHGLYPLVLFFVFGGAFTKSAQFPFHYWLPAAMSAPTPVSTYLHSATMVKAGIYILLRFSPALGDHPYWNYTIMAFGCVTMAYGAFHALFRTDLKGILAYSTIAALGTIVFLIGLGTKDAFVAAIVFILVHALYKAALFLVAGIIDHSTRSRDITQLRGLGKVLLPAAIAGVLAALSNGGIIPMFGFVAKDLIYETTLASGNLSYWFTAMAILTNVFLLYAGFLVGIKPFIGKLPAEYERIHHPSPLMWIPPILLGVLSLGFGLFPHFIGESFVVPALGALGIENAEVHLKLWHGFNPVFWFSVLTVALGCGLYLLMKPSHRREGAIQRLEGASPRTLSLNFAKAFFGFSRFWTRTFQNGYLRYYIHTIIVFLIGITGFKLWTETSLSLPRDVWSNFTLYEGAILLIMFVAVCFTVFTASRLAAVVAMGVVGYIISLIFVFYSAPDLAMTQFAIDTLTVMLFVLVLYRLPKYLTLSNTRSRIRDGVLALVFGTLMTVLTLEVLYEPTVKDTARFYAENAYILAKGKNVVNVILVDFRGADTMVEIMVLSIAAIGVFGLLKLRLKKSHIDD